MRSAIRNSPFVDSVGGLLNSLESPTLRGITSLHQKDHIKMKTTLTIDDDVAARLRRPGVQK